MDTQSLDLASLAQKYFIYPSLSSEANLLTYEKLWSRRRNTVKSILYSTIHPDEFDRLLVEYFPRAKVYTIGMPNRGHPRIVERKAEELMDLIISNGRPELDHLLSAASELPPRLSETGLGMIFGISNSLWLGDIKMAFDSKFQSKIEILNLRSSQLGPPNILLVLDLTISVPNQFLSLPRRSGIQPIPPISDLKFKNHPGVLRSGTRVKPLPMAWLQPTLTPKPESIFDHHPMLFHKYRLGLSSPNPLIPYQIITVSTTAATVICHFHLFDTSMVSEFVPYLRRINRHLGIILTFSYGETSPILELKLSNLTLLQVPNRGYDIGGKLCALDFMQRQQLPIEYIFFLHSKSDPVRRKQYFDPFLKSDARFDLIYTLLQMKKTNLLGIFPNVPWYDFEGHKNYDETTKFVYNWTYWEEMLNFLKCSTRNCLFVEGNCCVLHRSVVDYVFRPQYGFWYHLLNIDNSFDANWVGIFYPELAEKSIPERYAEYQRRGLYGNNTRIRTTAESIPDGMIEHLFERLWLNVISELGGKYLVMDSENLVTSHSIKLNAIYFPQFHAIPENDRFWGPGFTEWTLLKPFADTVMIGENETPILKPHSEIGYYDLSTKDELQRQISQARAYEIDGFLIYHYWFAGNQKVMYRPLEHFLHPDVTLPFAISWANEPWTRRWDGSNNEMLLEQEYGTIENYRAHIRYLIPFLQRENYIRTADGKCLFYIYHFQHLASHYAAMMEIWRIELDRHGLSIQIVLTENSWKSNHDLTVPGVQKFIFEPMYSTNYISRVHSDYQSHLNAVTAEDFDPEYYLETHSDIRAVYGSKENWQEEAWKHFDNYGRGELRGFKYGSTTVIPNWIYDYDDIRAKYVNGDYSTDGKHLGLPLFWNNVVRRKNLPYLAIKNCSPEKIGQFLHLLIAIIVLRSADNWDGSIRKGDNIINVNAFNEWNEQAMLEPNTIHGYGIMETISGIMREI